MSEDTDQRRERKRALWRGIVSSRKYLNAPDAELPPTHQAIYHFTREDQIESLVAARDADPDRGFMARLMTLCSLPRTNLGDQLQYKRTNGPYKLIMIAGGDNKLPYGSLPRLLLAWVCTEAVRTQSRKIVLGKSLAEFMRTLGIYNSGGSPQTRLRNQMKRLFNASVSLIYEGKNVSRSINSVVASRTEFWWNERKPDEPVLWDSTIELGHDLFDEIIRNPVPLDMNILKGLKRSPLGLDLYLWLTYRTFNLTGPHALSWRQLYEQFGAEPSKARDKITVQAFRRKVLRELAKIKTSWPALHYRVKRGTRGEKNGQLILHPSPPTIATKDLLPLA